MQNLSTTHRQDIVEHNDIFVPAGKGKTAFIDVRDIAAVAAKVLTEPGGVVSWWRRQRALSRKWPVPNQRFGIGARSAWWNGRVLTDRQ